MNPATTVIACADFYGSGAGRSPLDDPTRLRRILLVVTFTVVIALPRLASAVPVAAGSSHLVAPLP